MPCLRDSCVNNHAQRQIFSSAVLSFLGASAMVFSRVCGGAVVVCADPYLEKVHRRGAEGTEDR
jgi:hypothetical protein